MPKGSKAKTKLARNELLVAFFILVLSGVGFVYSQRAEASTVTVDGQEFKVQVADDLAERRLGLSGQSALENDEGMIFIFEESGMHGFWMKDMNFSIDIIWIDENFRVVHIEDMISPSTFPESFVPSVDARYVLEVYTGQAAAQGIDLGDEVVFDL